MLSFKGLILVKNSFVLLFDKNKDLYQFCQSLQYCTSVELEYWLGT